MENKGLRTFLEALETTGFDALRRKKQGGGGIPGKGGIRYFGAARKKRAPPAAPAAQEAQEAHRPGRRPGGREVDLYHAVDGFDRRRLHGADRPAFF